MEYLIIYEYDARCHPSIILADKDKKNQILEEYERTGLISHIEVWRNNHEEKIKPIKLYICKIENEFTLGTQ